MVSSESSLSTQVFARADSLSAMHPTAWMAFLATITFTSVAYSLERGRKGGREGGKEGGREGGREQVEKGRKGEGREERGKKRGKEGEISLINTCLYNCTLSVMANPSSSTMLWAFSMVHSSVSSSSFFILT